MMKINIAVILPVHRDKFYYAFNFLNNLQNKNNVFLIFTNQEELLQFKLQYKKHINFFVLSDYFDEKTIQIITLRNLMPVIKKLFFVSKIIKQFDYVLPLDDDFLIINYDLLFEACKQFSKNKTFTAGETNNHHTLKIIETSMSILDKHKNFESLIQFKKFYFWLSEIPIYEKESTISFLNFIDFDDKIFKYIQKYNEFFFDTLAYNYWCILEYDYKINVIDWNFSLEDCPEEVWLEQNNNKKLFSINHNIYSNQNVALLIHTDRLKNQSFIEHSKEFTIYKNKKINQFYNDVNIVLKTYNQIIFDSTFTEPKKLKIIITTLCDTKSLKITGLGFFITEIISAFVKRNYSITLFAAEEIYYFNENVEFDKKNIKDYDLIIVNNPLHFLNLNIHSKESTILNIVHSELFEFDYPIQSKFEDKPGFINYDLGNCYYLAVRSEIKEYLINEFHLDPKKIQVVLNPISNEFFDNEANVDKNNTGIFAGNYSIIRQNAAIQFAKICKDRNLKSIYLGTLNNSESFLLEHFDEVLPFDTNYSKYLKKASLCGGIQKGRTYWEAKLLGVENIEFCVNKMGQIIFIQNELNNDKIEKEKLKIILNPDFVADYIIKFALKNIKTNAKEKIITEDQFGFVIK